MSELVVGKIDNADWVVGGALGLGTGRCREFGIVREATDHLIEMISQNIPSHFTLPSLLAYGPPVAPMV